jgi:hypothetical protein
MDIIERAARAIFSCNFALHEQQEVIDQKWFEWPEDRRKAERQARAVLSALREPDEGMKRAAIDAAPFGDPKWLTVSHWGRETITDGQCVDIWQAMIDQALKG